MQRFKGIAALLMLVLMMPLPRACAAMSHGAKVQPECCPQHKVDPCCEGPSKLCCAAQAPADQTLYPGQNVLLLGLSPTAVAMVYSHRVDSLRSLCLALRSPAQHAPPGLLIAATIVLRI